MSAVLDGLVTFFASHHAIRAEKVLTAAGLTVRLIAGPKDLSPNCGVALRIRIEDREAVVEHLAEANVEVDSVIPYQPRIDQWRAPSRRLGLRKRLARRRSR